MLILDNGTTALSGGQPHPASGADARGQARRAVGLAELARAAGVERVVEVNLDAGEKIQDPIEQGLGFDGVAVVIARGRCPTWSNGATTGSIDETGASRAAIEPAPPKTPESRSPAESRMGGCDIEPVLRQARAG